MNKETLINLATGFLVPIAIAFSLSLTACASTASLAQPEESPAAAEKPVANKKPSARDAPTAQAAATRVAPAGKTKKPDLPPQSSQKVPVTVSAPTTSFANKPFIVIFRLTAPSSSFARDLISVDQGELTYFVGNQEKTVYRILVVPDPDLLSSDNPITTVRLAYPTSGDITHQVRIIEPPGKGNKAPEPEPHLLAQILLGYGGNAISGTDVQVGNTMGVQLGLTYPVAPSISSSSIRIHFGYEGLNMGKESEGDYSEFNYVNADLLYEIILSSKHKLIGGATVAAQPKLKSQKMEFSDIEGTHNTEVKFGDAYGVKLMLEYVPFDIIPDNMNFYINAGLALINFVPNRITVAESEENDEFARPSLVNGSSFKIAFGLRY